MKTKGAIGMAGGIVLMIATFLPFVDYYGTSFNLWNYPVVSQTASAITFLALGLGSMLCSFKGGKIPSIATMAFGIITISLILLKTRGAFALYGLGPWLILLGGALLIISGIKELK